MIILDPGEEPTENGYQKLSNIDSDFHAFGSVLASRIDTKGNA